MTTTSGTATPSAATTRTASASSTSRSPSTAPSPTRRYPWLAEKWEYNDDFTELRITTRSGITWSDGEPFSAADVAYTLNAVRDANTKVRFGVEVAQFVDEATAESDTEAVVKFKVPAPRFFYFMTYKYDIGLYIVPKHIFENEDIAAFKAFDIEKGLPVTTGPWKLVFSSPDQKVIDVRDSWWAVDQGLVDAMPQVQRIIYLPWTQETQIAEQLISNEIDESLDLRPLTMETILAQNPSIITHTFSDPPYGYVDWWPTSLYVNCEREPWSDADVRWALSYFIDRDQVIQVALGGAGSVSTLPLPTYPGLTPFFESVSDLLEQYPTTEFNPDKGAALLAREGLGEERRRHVGERRQDDRPRHQQLRRHGRHRPGHRRATAEAGRQRLLRHAARLLRSLQSGRLQRRPLRPRRQRQRRSLLHPGPLPVADRLPSPAGTRSTSASGTTTSSTRSSTRWRSRRRTTRRS